MDFAYSEEQRMLADSVGRFARDVYSFENWRKLSDTEDGFDRAHWARMAELGWLGACLPEEYGGLNGGGVEAMVIAEAFGRGLVQEPYMWTAIVGAGLVLAGGSAAQRAELLPAIAEGGLILSLASAEPQSRFDLNDVACSAKAEGGGYVLSGHKSVVFHAQSADRLIVAARTAGAQRDRDGISLFLVPAQAEGLTRRDYRTTDRRRASDLTFYGVRLGPDALLGPPGGGLPLLEQAVDRGTAFACAEAVGAMAMLNEATLAYVKTRRQFGRAIGDFQVIQHRLVDMMAALEEARSLALVAAVRLDAPAPERARAVAAAKAKAGQSGRFVGQQAIQLHGGMGMTDELSVGHYYKRLMMLDVLFGNADHQRQRFAAMG
jgi:alkylation response protein AidB-like acyl-CoA dehydrogenase